MVLRLENKAVMLFKRFTYKLIRCGNSRGFPPPVSGAATCLVPNPFVSGSATQHSITLKKSTHLGHPCLSPGTLGIKLRIFFVSQLVQLVNHTTERKDATPETLFTSNYGAIPKRERDIFCFSSEITRPTIHHQTPPKSLKPSHHMSYIALPPKKNHFYLI